MREKKAFQNDSEVAAWLERSRLSPSFSEDPGWSLTLSMSTALLPDWLLGKSKLPTDALGFSVNVHWMNGWRAEVKTRDERFKLSWSASHPVSVVSDSLLHRHRTPWPDPDNLDEIPSMIPIIEAPLEEKFIRDVSVNASSLRNSDLDTIRRWLSPVCDTITSKLGRFYGAMPDAAVCGKGGDTGAIQRFV